MTGCKHVRRVSDFRAHSLLFGHIRSSFRLSSDIIQDLSGPVKPGTKTETAHEVQIQAQNLGSYIAYDISQPEVLPTQDTIFSVLYTSTPETGILHERVGPLSTAGYRRP